MLKYEDLIEILETIEFTIKNYDVMKKWYEKQDFKGTSFEKFESLDYYRGKRDILKEILGMERV